MVRVASLASFPHKSFPREFYGNVPIAEEEPRDSYIQKKRDRIRKQKKRDAIKEQKQQQGMPEEVLTLFKRNGGEV